MKYRAILLAVALCSGAVLISSGTSAAAPTSFTCTGTVAGPAPQAIPAGTYSSLSMPKNSFCTINKVVTVQSPTTIGSGAVLVVLSNGNLTVGGGLTIGTGAIFGNENNHAPITINGPVSVGNDAVLVIGLERPGKPLVSSLQGVTGNKASSVQIHNSTVGGSVTLTGGGADNATLDALTGCTTPPCFNNFNDLEDNNIGGSVSITGYKGVWAGVIRDTIQGPFTFNNNVENPVDEYDIGSDVIQGGAMCNKNNPAPNMGGSPGSPSTVQGQTTGNQAATCTGV
jgi:hypothetical protein